MRGRGSVVQDLRLLVGGGWKILALKSGEWKKLLKKMGAHTGLSADGGDEFTMLSVAAIRRVGQKIAR
jgi:hypothetical protein